MGFLKNQFSSVIEWNENGAGILFYKFQNQEIKKGSRLIIRPGQDAIFLYNGKVEGIFRKTATTISNRISSPSSPR